MSGPDVVKYLHMISSWYCSPTTLVTKATCWVFCQGCHVAIFSPWLLHTSVYSEGSEPLSSIKNLCRLTTATNHLKSPKKSAQHTKMGKNEDSLVRRLCVPPYQRLGRDLHLHLCWCCCWFCLGVLLLVVLVVVVVGVSLLGLCRRARCRNAD